MLKDRYELGVRLADGPNGTVYRAVSTGASVGPREVAFLVLPEHVARERAAFAALAQEFAELRRLDHPHVARLFELGCDDEGCYCTSEWLDGEPLRAVLAHLRPERLDRVEADGIVRAVGSALAHAHARGIAHGQVRAEHVVITMDRRCVLTDFLWRRLDETAASPPTADDDVRALAQLALEVYTGLPIREALQHPERVPDTVLEAVREVSRARPPESPPSVAEFLARAELVAAHEEAPLRAAPRPPRGSEKPPRNGLRLVRLGSFLVVTLVATLGLLTFYGATDRDWRDSAGEIRRVGAETLRSLAARWTPPAERERAAVPVPPVSDPDSSVTAAELPSEDDDSSEQEREAPLPEAEREEARLPIASDAEDAVAIATAPAAPPVPEPEAPPPVLSLDVSAIAVRENHGAVAIDVVRTGDATARASVAWWTTPGSAEVDDDYASFGTTILEFPPGETVRRVLVPIVDDGIREPDETFLVHLASRPRGATVGRVSATRVTVHDDD